MRKIRFYSALLAFLFIISMHPNALEFSDVDHSFAKSSIYKWSDRGIISGYSGKFMPDRGLTRGELAVILNRIFNFPNNSAKMSDFKDLKEAFYTKSMLALYEQKIMVGHRGYLRAEDLITREEAAVVLLRAFQISGISVPIHFEDADLISNWAKDSLSYMAENKFMNTYQNKLSPKDNITRAQFVKILDNIVVDYIEEGEYNGSKMEEKAGILIVKAPHTTIKNLSTQVEILSTASNKSMNFETSQIHSLKSLGDTKKEIQLANTQISNLKNDGQIEIRVDKQSKLPNRIRENVVILPNPLKNKSDNGLKDVTGAGYSDEYSPIIPDHPIVQEKKEELPKTVSDALWIVLPNMKDDGILYLSASGKQGNDFALPDFAILVNKKNGENSGKEIPLIWKDQNLKNKNLEEIHSNKIGEYVFYAVANEDVIINGLNYKTPWIKAVVNIR